MTDELQPRPEPEPLPDETPVETLDEDDEEFELVEPPNATRLSPYAISSLVIAVLAAFELPSAIAYLGFISIGSGGVVRVVAPSIAAVAFAGLAMWLAARAEDEIFVEERAFGGVGLYRAARILSIMVIIILVLAAVIGIIVAVHSGQTVSPTIGP